MAPDHQRGRCFLFVLALAVPLIPLSESSSIEIGVPPQRLWDALHELSNRAAWYPEVRGVAVTRSGPGLAKQQVSLALSRGAVLNVTPIESVAPERMVSRVTGPGIRSILTQELVPIAGGTLYATSDNLRVSIIVALVRAAGGRRFKTRRAARMEQIKRDVEAASVGPDRRVTSS